MGCISCTDTPSCKYRRSDFPISVRSISIVSTAKVVFSHRKVEIRACNLCKK